MRTDAKHPTRLGCSYLPHWCRINRHTPGQLGAVALTTYSSRNTEATIHTHTRTPVNINAPRHNASKQAANVECPVSASLCHRAKLQRFISETDSVPSPLVKHS